MEFFKNLAENLVTLICHHRKGRQNLEQSSFWKKYVVFIFKLDNSLDYFA